jgi:NAD(P)-dependent dehydrogenase (short-subunit alcohol dehydrogenase family)
MNISESVVLITGVSSGLGNSCAKRILRRGGKVLGIDIGPANNSMVEANPDNYFHAQADVRDESTVLSAIEGGVSRFGKLSGVVTCAGILHGERVLGRDGAASLEGFRKVIDVNLIGTFNVIRLAVSKIAAAVLAEGEDERGVIVMTSSVAAFEGQVGQSAYSASKGAVASMTLPMARELSRHGIRVVSIAPGVFETPMMQAASDKVRQPLLEQTIFPRRFGEPDEFAMMVEQAFENKMLNGCVLRLDGALRM